jgi:hypothetical protein
MLGMEVGFVLISNLGTWMGVVRFMTRSLYILEKRTGTHSTGGAWCPPAVGLDACPSREPNDSSGIAARSPVTIPTTLTRLCAFELHPHFTQSPATEIHCDMRWKAEKYSVPWFLSFHYKSNTKWCRLIIQFPFIRGLKLSPSIIVHQTVEINFLSYARRRIFVIHHPINHRWLWFIS